MTMNSDRLVFAEKERFSEVSSYSKRRSKNCDQMGSIMGKRIH